ncbi:cystathionine gamma-synthase [Sphingomonas sp.]|uniref:cystathionine gamma-synthase n=1 Tax=Sphingomonas sp. TaxID=28214 RepID=UPI002FD9C7B7
MTDHPHRETLAATFGVATDTAFGAVVPPLHSSTTFTFAGFDQPRTFDYGRSGNPTRAMLADALAGFEGGAGAVVTGSGMAAIDLVLSELGPDDLLIAPHNCYGGTYRLMRARADKGQFRLAVVDQTDIDAVRQALAAQPALVFVETPSNPLMRVVDVRAMCAAAHSAGARVAVDNTFLSPALQRPISLGADYVVHSTTKFLNGHSDVVGGAVIAADHDACRRLADWANTAGLTGSPYDAWLTLRGLRTIFARLERQQRTAAAVAAYLQDQPQVRRVHYPGLADHPDRAIVAAQQDGPGAMLSFELDGGRDQVRRFLEGIQTFILAESLGGVESLVAHPTTMTHRDLGEEGRKRAGIKDNLIRLSVGLEHVDDLISGLDAGFSRVLAGE